MAGEVLIGGSLAWIIIWSALGMIPGQKHMGWIEEMKTISQEGDLGKFWSSYDGFRKVIATHAHATNFACVSFLVGLAMIAGLIGYSMQLQLGIATWMIVVIVLSGIGTRFRKEIIIAPANILFLVALIVSFIGLFV